MERGGRGGGGRAVTCDEGESLHPLEVGVLNGHDAGVGEQLLGVVVDQLPAATHTASGQHAQRRRPQGVQPGTRITDGRTVLLNKRRHTPNVIS